MPAGFGIYRGICDPVVTPLQPVIGASSPGHARRPRSRGGRRLSAGGAGTPDRCSASLHGPSSSRRRLLRELDMVSAQQRFNDPLITACGAPTLPSMGAPRAAVVLAAGMGMRLREVLPDRPKGLLHVGSVTPIQRSLATLYAHQVERVVLVAGYRAEAYRTFLRGRLPAVELVINPDYERAGSMRSLHIARDRLADDFLLLESDLLYEPRAITELLRQPHRDCILASGPTGQGDEVYAYGTAGRLALLSKSRLPQPPLLGEFVEIGRA